MSEAASEPDSARDSGPPFLPLLAGGAVALIGAVLFGGLFPLAALLWWPGLIVPAFAIGSKLRRWWIVPIPIVIAIPLALNPSDCDSSMGDCATPGAIGVFFVLFLGVVVTLGLLAGVIVGRDSQR